MSGFHWVGDFGFYFEDDAVAWQEWLDTPESDRPVLKKLQPGAEGGWWIDSVLCFTGLCYLERSTGLYFMEDADGITPARWEGEVGMDQVQRLAEWWIWYAARRYEGNNGLKSDGSRSWSWYTSVYPEARTFDHWEIRKLLGNEAPELVNHDPGHYLDEHCTVLLGWVEDSNGAPMFAYYLCPLESESPFGNVVQSRAVQEGRESSRYGSLDYWRMYGSGSRKHTHVGAMISHRQEFINLHRFV